MKTAIDNYELGKQKEVSADIFQYSFNADHRRFKCPECGEPVSLVIKTNSKYFRHHNKVETSKECDRRVDGDSNLNIYERLGLPLYLRKNNNGVFYFAASFRSVPEEILLQCEKKNAFIYLHEINSSRYIKYNIDGLRFNSSAVTFIPINRLPRYSSRLYIKYSDNYTKSYLKKYWPEYINCLIPMYGSLFSVEENEGKIIRPGDNISTYTEYYWVKTSDRLPNYSGIQMNKVGQFELDNINYFVYKGSFDVKTENKRDYRNLSNYLEDNLKVSLLEKKSTVIPLWPPCIKNDMGYEMLKKSTIYNRVISTNEEPIIHIYTNDFINADSRKVSSVGKVKLVSLFNMNEILINVDKKLSSTGLLFKINRIPNIIGNNPLIETETEKNICDINMQNNVKKINLKSLSCLNIIKLSKDGSLNERVQLDNNIDISDIRYGDKYFILSNKYNIATIIINEKEIVSERVDEACLMKLVKTSSNTHLVIMTLKMRKLILKILDKTSSLEVKHILRKYLQTNVIPLRIYNYLGGKYNE